MVYSINETEGLGINAPEFLENPDGRPRVTFSAVLVQTFPGFAWSILFNLAGLRGTLITFLCTIFLPRQVDTRIVIL